MLRTKNFDFLSSHRGYQEIDSWTDHRSSGQGKPVRNFICLNHFLAKEYFFKINIVEYYLDTLILTTINCLRRILAFF